MNTLYKNIILSFALLASLICSTSAANLEHIELESLLNSEEVIKGAFNKANDAVQSFNETQEQYNSLASEQNDEIRLDKFSTIATQMGGARHQLTQAISDLGNHLDNVAVEISSKFPNQSNSRKPLGTQYSYEEILNSFDLSITNENSIVEFESQDELELAKAINRLEHLKGYIAKELPAISTGLTYKDSLNYLKHLSVKYDLLQVTLMEIETVMKLREDGVNLASLNRALNTNRDFANSIISPVAIKKLVTDTKVMIGDKPNSPKKLSTTKKTLTHNPYN